MFKDADLNIKNKLGSKPVDLLDSEDVVNEWDPENIIKTKQLLLDDQELGCLETINPLTWKIFQPDKKSDFNLVMFWVLMAVTFSLLNIYLYPHLEMTNKVNTVSGQCILFYIIMTFSLILRFMNPGKVPNNPSCIMKLNSQFKEINT